MNSDQNNLNNQNSNIIFNGNLNNRIIGRNNLINVNGKIMMSDVDGNTIDVSNNEIKISNTNGNFVRMNNNLQAQSSPQSSASMNFNNGVTVGGTASGCIIGNDISIENKDGKTTITAKNPTNSVVFGMDGNMTQIRAQDYSTNDSDKIKREREAQEKLRNYNHFGNPQRNSSTIKVDGDNNITNIGTTGNRGNQYTSQSIYVRGNGNVSGSFNNSNVNNSDSNNSQNYENIPQMFLHGIWSGIASYLQPQNNPVNQTTSNHTSENKTSMNNPLGNQSNFQPDTEIEHNTDDISSDSDDGEEGTQPCRLLLNSPMNDAMDETTYDS